MAPPKTVTVKPSSQAASEPKQECVMSGALYLIFRVSQVLGLAPVRFQKRNELWHVRISPKLRFINYTAMVFLNISFVVCMVSADPLGKMIKIYNTHIGYFTWAFTYVTVMMAACISGGAAPTRAKGIIHCLFQILKIKNTLNSDIVKENSMKYKILSVLWLLYMLTTFVADYCKNYPDEKGHLYTSLLHIVSYIQVFVSLLSIQQFVFVVLEINLVLKGINDLLEALLHTNKENSQMNIVLGLENRSADQVIHQLSQMYSCICELVKILNDATGCTNMAVLVTSFLSLITTPYALIVSYMHGINQLDHITATANWFVNYLIWTLMTIEPCHRTSSEMARTNILVSKLAMKNTDQLAGAELDKFYQYLLLYKVTFSPMEICTLGRPLFATITTSVTTYLVILIQFQTLDGNSN